MKLLDVTETSGQQILDLLMKFKIAKINERHVQAKICVKCKLYNKKTVLSEKYGDTGTHLLHEYYRYWLKKGEAK